MIDNFFQLVGIIAVAWYGGRLVGYLAVKTRDLLYRCDDGEEHRMFHHWHYTGKTVEIPVTSRRCLSTQKVKREEYECCRCDKLKYLRPMPAEF